jgi:Protein of unknown function (DUF4238)
MAMVSPMGQFDHIASALLASPVTAELKRITASGDYSQLDANGAKRHHFLPQFQLRGFAQTLRGKYCVFQMDATGRGAPRPVDVRTAASRRRLYAVATDDGPSNRLEGYLALVETHAAPALRRLTDAPTSLSPADRSTIAHLVALQTMRTPSAADQVTRVANAALKMAAGGFFSDSRAVADLYREKVNGDGTDEAIARFRDQVLDQIRAGEIRLDGSQGAAFATAFQHASESVPILIACHWTLLRSPTGGFITSDRGHAIDDPSPPYAWVAPALLSSERVEVSAPLGDADCLLIHPGFADAGLDVREVSAHEIEQINLRTFGWAQKYVFAKSQATLQAVRVASRRHPARVTRPKPFCHITLIECDPDDNSLAEANVRRGWPARLPNDAGELCDYLVIPDDEPHAEQWNLADELAKRRAQKRAGMDPTKPAAGRIINQMLHPLDIPE